MSIYISLRRFFISTFSRNTLANASPISFIFSPKVSACTANSWYSPETGGLDPNTLFRIDYLEPPLLAEFGAGGRGGEVWEEDPSCLK